MADRFAILGQLSPANTSEATLYTVPSPAAKQSGGSSPVDIAPKSVSQITQSLVSSIIVCSRHANNTDYTIRLTASGSALAATEEYIFSETAIVGNTTHVLGLALTLGAGDAIKITSGAANYLTFTAMGIEVT